MWSAIASFLGTLLAKLFSSPSRLESQTDRAARAETKGEVSEASAETQARISQAVTDAPKDRDGVVKALREGEF